MSEKMNGVNKTLYIPLYGKSFVSKKGLFLIDKKAEEIWEREGFTLKGKAKSKWLAYYMGIRSAVFDEWLKEQMALNKEAVILHVGCGLDSRVLRVGAKNHKWYDVDFLEVIKERKRYYTESDNYQMIVGDVRENKWLESIENSKSAVVVMEGVSMYLTPSEMQNFTASLSEKFEKVSLLVDTYSTFSAKMSKYKNPINEVGVSKVYGIDDPLVFQSKALQFTKQIDITPKKFVSELKGLEKFIFANLYAGSFSKKLYRLYEYKKG